MSPFEHVWIETDRLVLRTFRPTDGDAFYAATRDPTLYETLPEDHLYSRTEIEQIVGYFLDCYPRCRMNDVPKFALAMIERTSGTMIGDVGIGRYSGDPNVHEIFYFVRPTHWNRGYGSEAASALLDHIRRNRLVDSLIGTVVQGNTASARILTKNGFRQIDHSYPDSRNFFELRLDGL